MTTVRTTMLVIRATNLYVYLRITLSIIMSRFSIKQKTSKPKSTLVIYLTLISNIPVIYIVCIYRLRLKKDYFDRVDNQNLAKIHSIEILNHQKAPCCTPSYKKNRNTDVQTSGFTALK